MNNSEKNIISVNLKEVQHKYKLVLTVNDNEEIASKPFEKTYLQSIKEEFNTTLRIMNSLMNHNALNVQDLNKLSEVIEEIRTFSSTFLCNIFGLDNSCKIHKKIYELIVTEIDNLLYSEDPVGKIVYNGDISEFIPLEYLFIENKECNASLNNLSDFILSLSQILGFSFIIHRNHRNPTERNILNKLCNFIPSLSQILGFSFIIHRNHRNLTERNNKGDIPFEEKLNIEIYACNNGNLRNVQHEIDFFTKHNENYFAAKLEYPEMYSKNAEKELIDKLTGNDPQFHHLCCHCFKSRNKRFHYLKFGQKKINLAKLQRYYLYNYMKSDSRKPIKKTILFLNACECAAVDPLAMVTFPKVFREDFKYMGFIGTEYLIVDDFACDFARVFYSNLLRFGYLDIALFKTRWFFAKKYSNPLGLFYTLYADPSIKLSRIVDSVQF